MAPDLLELVLLLIALPVAVALFFGYFGARRRRNNVYSCLRCGATFRAPSTEPYPRTCPSCESPAWHSQPDEHT